MTNMIRGPATVLLFSFLCGCGSRVAISVTSVATAIRLPESGQVHGYPNMPEEDRQRGPYYVLHLESEDDLAQLAPKYTHHLFFTLMPCSQTERGYQMWEGGVFIDAGPAAASSAAKSSGNRVNRYVVHIPMRAAPILGQVRRFGALDVERYLARAKQEDLCIRMGGGQIWGAFLSSNAAKTPLHFDENTGLSITR